jgi:hypothetical protein
MYQPPEGFEFAARRTSSIKENTCTGCAFYSPGPDFDMSTCPRAPLQGSSDRTEHLVCVLEWYRRHEENPSSGREDLILVPIKKPGAQENQSFPRGRSLIARTRS